METNFSFRTKEATIKKEEIYPRKWVAMTVVLTYLAFWLSIQPLK